MALVMEHYSREIASCENVLIYFFCCATQKKMVFLMMEFSTWYVYCKEK